MIDIPPPAVFCKRRKFEGGGYEKGDERERGKQKQKNEIEL